MKELLAKAWNKKEKRMYPVISINIFKKEVIVDTIAIGKEYKEKIPTLTYRYPLDVLLLHYIGAKDKNDKKVFEGDIVRWRHYEEEYSPDTFIQNDYVTGIVEWNDRECCFTIRQITEGMFKYKYAGFLSENYTTFYDEEGQNVFNWNDIEVIGNKFENPDMAEDKMTTLSD